MNDPKILRVDPKIWRPKILVFSCSFGGGHKAAATAVSSYLNEKYDVKEVNLGKKETQDLKSQSNRDSDVSE